MGDIIEHAIGSGEVDRSLHVSTHGALPTGDTILSRRLRLVNQAHHDEVRTRS
jgi:hypothetical protein